MTRSESLKKRGIILVILLVGTILFLKLLDWYSREKDVKLLQQMQEGKYELEASKETMSYTQIIEAIESEDSVVITKDATLYEESEARDVWGKLVQQLELLIVSPLSKELKEISTRGDASIIGAEVQIFKEFEHKIYSCQIGTLHVMTNDYDNITIVFDAETYKIFSVDIWARNYEGEMGDRNNDTSKIIGEEQWKRAIEYYQDVEGVTDKKIYADLGYGYLVICVYEESCFDFLENLFEKSYDKDEIQF